MYQKMLNKIENEKIIKINEFKQKNLLYYLT